MTNLTLMLNGYGFCILFVIVVTLLYSCFMPFKRSKRYIAVTLLISSVLYSTKNVTEHFIDVEYGISFLLLNILYLIITIYLIQRLFEGHWYKKIITAFIYAAIAILSDVITGLIIMYNLFQIDFEAMREASLGVDSENLVGLVSFIITFAIILLIKVGRRKKGMYIDRKYSILQISISFICVLCTVVLFIEIVISGNVPAKDVMFLIAFSGLLILFYAAFELSESIQRKNKQYQLQEQRHQLLEDYYERVELHQREIRTIKHDLKNQLLAISGYVKGAKADQATDQINELISQLSVGDQESFTLIPGLNALLNAKYRLAQDEEIVCDFTVKIPENIQISENDLSSVIGNILDNAIEACRHCSGKKYIQFKLVYYNHSLIIACENSTDRQNHSLKTRKKDSLNHGFGIESMKQITEKYNGNLNYQFDLHSFQIEISLFEKNTTGNTSV